MKNSAQRCSGLPFQKGQVATEFFLYVTVFMFVVIASFVIVNHIQSIEIPAREYSVAKEIGGSFAEVVALSVKGGAGFSYNYTFPRTISAASSTAGNPYNIYFLTGKNHTLIIEWPGTYGNFSYSYVLPAYNYKYSGCMRSAGSSVYYMNSRECPNVLYLYNDGENLTITQG